MNDQMQHSGGNGSALSLEGIEAVLFDLDGTLLEVDMHRFIPAYLEGLASRLDDLVPGRVLAEGLQEGVTDMLKRVDGRSTLEGRLLTHLRQSLAIPPARYRQALDEFCLENIHDLSSYVTGHPLARQLLASCRRRDWRVVLATNPIFPRAVIDVRLQWAGLDSEYFHFITDYETSRHCKPHVEYFREVLDKLRLPPEACLMVGNDSRHDMAASQVGIRTCLLTPWRIDHRGPGFPADWEGTHEEFLELLEMTADGSRGEDAERRRSLRPAN